MTLQQKLFGFDGRLRRRDWWVLGLAAGFVWFVVTLMMRSLTGFWSSELFAGPAGYLVFVIVDLAIAAPFLWVQTALNAKRAHDINQSAAAIILLQTLYIIGSYAPLHLTRDSPVPGVGFMFIGVRIVVAVVAIIYFFILAFREGSPLANEYGTSPKAEDRPGAPEPDRA